MPKPIPPPLFAPTPDQSTVRHLQVRVDKINPVKGGFALRVVSGELGFYLSIPGKQNPFKPGDVLIAEWPKSGKMLFDPFTAIYPAHMKPEPVKNQKGESDMSKELMPVTVSSISGMEVQTINARELHAFLEIQTLFKDWITRRIEEYDFIDGKDFCSFLSESSGGRPSKEYSITLDMAKELSMVERNEKGKIARQYFIECEKQLRSGVQPITHSRRADSELNARSAAVSFRMMARMKVYPEEMRAVFAARAVTALTGEPIQPLLPPIQNRRDTWLTPAMLAERFNTSSTAIGRKLKALGLHGEADTEHKHSQPVWNKSQYSDRQVVSYLYDPDVVLPPLAGVLSQVPEPAMQ
jgi:anti-repressor protein